MECCNCEEKIEEGENYKMVKWVGMKKEKPICDVCWDDYEENEKKKEDN